MSTLDCAGNSNGEVPVFLWEIARKHPMMAGETPGQYYDKLLELCEKNNDPK